MATGTQPQPGSENDTTRKVLDQLVGAIRDGDRNKYFAAQRNFAASGLSNNSELGRLVAEAGALVRREKVSADNPWNNVNLESLGYPSDEAKEIRDSLSGRIAVDADQEKKETKEVEPVTEEEAELEPVETEDLEEKNEEETKEERNSREEEEYRRTDLEQPDLSVKPSNVPSNEDELDRLVRMADPTAVWKENNISNRAREFQTRANNLLADSPFREVEERVIDAQEDEYQSKLTDLEMELRTQASSSPRGLQKSLELSRVRKEQRLATDIQANQKRYSSLLSDIAIEKKRADLGYENKYDALQRELASNQEEFKRLARDYRANDVSIKRKDIPILAPSFSRQIGHYVANRQQILPLSANIRNQVEGLKSQEDIEAINSKLRSNIQKNDPLAILGLNPSKSYTPAQVKEAYAQSIAALSASSDPTSLDVLERFQRKMTSFIDSVDAIERTPNLGDKELNKVNNLYSVALRSQDSSQNLQMVRNEYNDINMGDVWKRFMADKKQGGEFYQAKGRKIVGKGALVAAGALPVGVGIGAKKVLWDAPKWAGKGIYKQAKKSERVRRRIIEPSARAANYTITKARKVKEKATSFRKMLWDLGRMVYANTLEGIVETVKNGGRAVARAYTNIRPRAFITRFMTNVQSRVFAGTSGRILINTARGFRGLSSVAKAIPHGIGTGTMAGIAQLLIFGSLNPAIVGAAFLTGTGARLLDRTLASTTPHFYKPIADFQYRFGSLRNTLEGPLPKGDIRGLSRFQMGVKTINTGFYGFAGGAAIASLLGFNPLLGAILGAGTAMSARYLTEFAANKLVNNMRYDSLWMRVGSTMPFQSLVGAALAIPWIKFQMMELYRAGFDREKLGNYFKENWWGITGILNSLQALGIVNSVAALSSWVAANPQAWYGIAGTASGIAFSVLVLGMPLSSAVLVGGIIGGGIGLAIGTFFGPLGMFGLSFLGSVIGSFIGSLVDRALGGAENALKALSYLNSIKAILDFFSALTNNSKNLVMASMAFVLFLVMGGSLSFEGLNLSSSHDSSAEERNSSGNGGSSQGDNGSEVAGESITRTTLECTISKRELINPQRSILVKISEENGVYTLETEHNIFTGLVRLGDGLEVTSTVSKGKIIGYCR